MYLNATEAGNDKKQVNINPNKGIGVDFTLGKNDPDMQIFVKDPTSEELNWILPSYTIKESWQVTETIYDYEGNVLSKKVFKSKEEFEEYQREQERIAVEKAKKTALIKDIKEKMSSKLKVYSLGYINCDRFYDEPMITLMVDGDEEITAEYYLVYKDVRGVMTGRVGENNIVRFGNIPRNREGVLIAVSFVEDQAYCYQSTITAGKHDRPTIKLEPVEESYLDQVLASLK